MKLTNSNLYPKSFCATRWVENKCVATKILYLLKSEIIYLLTNPLFWNLTSVGRNCSLLIYIEVLPIITYLPNSKPFYQTLKIYFRKLKRKILLQCSSQVILMHIHSCGGPMVIQLTKAQKLMNSSLNLDYFRLYQSQIKTLHVLIYL